MSSQLLTVTGTVYVRERISLPPGAIATIKLVDGEGEVLAGTATAAERTCTGKESAPPPLDDQRPVAEPAGW